MAANDNTINGGKIYTTARVDQSHPLVTGDRGARREPLLSGANPRIDLTKTGFEEIA